MWGCPRNACRRGGRPEASADIVAVLVAAAVRRKQRRVGGGTSQCAALRGERPGERWHKGDAPRAGASLGSVAQLAIAALPAHDEHRTIGALLDVPPLCAQRLRDPYASAAEQYEEQPIAFFQALEDRGDLR